MDFVLTSRGVPTLAIVGLIFTSYVIYQRYFHPLAKFPGPLMASLTNFWKVYHLWSHKLPDTMLQLHQKYGPILRIGPNDLDFQDADAVAAIYKSGRIMPKSSFYDGFTAFKANVFGTRDEALHAMRRRQMAHGFSANSLKAMEDIFDRHINSLRVKLDKYAISGDAFDLKDIMSYYGYDLTGELAFSTQYGSQEADDPANLPPINDHILLSCMYGAVADVLPVPQVRTITSWFPSTWMQGLLKSRAGLRDNAGTCVAAAIENHKSDKKTHNLLTYLIDAKDPETGMRLDVPDIASEAFAFLIAGSHTTSSTLTFLFYHILRDPTVAQSLIEELDAELVPLPQGAYEYSGLESKLKYTMACIRENFRQTPVFTMPLPRVVAQERGAEISGAHIPEGTNVSIVNYCLHHNPKIWGPTHDTFDPTRFLPSSPLYDPSHANILMQFGIGHRQCIGRNIALISIMKIVVTLMRNYSLELVNKDEGCELVSVGIGEKKGPLIVRVKRRTPEEPIKIM